MTTAKRRIPINQNGQATSAAERGAARQSAPEQGPAAVPAEEAQPREPDAARGDTAQEAVWSTASADSVAGDVADPVAEAEVLDETGAVAAERDRLLQERDALLDNLLRLRAEFDNFRKRMSRELVEARERAQGDLLGELLPVLDNLERALDAAEHHDEGKVLAGVRLTRDMFADLLRRSGVEEIETVGKPFDPTVHEAIAVQPSSEEEGAIAAVLERGYRQGSRVLRPARVVVSAGLKDAGQDD